MNLMRVFSMMLAILLAVPVSLHAEDEAQEPAPIHYYRIKPSLVANLATGGRYVRCDIQLMTRDEAFVESLTLHDAAIRHTLLLLLSDQDGAQIKTPDGQEELRQEALKQINTLLEGQTGKKAGVESLFFTTFFVQ